MAMDFHEALAYAQHKSHIHRTRKNLLYTFGATRLPYVCLSESPDEAGKIVVRAGELTADKPQIALPGQPFQFEGFDLAEDAESDWVRILISRRIEIPAGKFIHTVGASHTERGPIEASIERAMETLEKNNDIRTAVLSTPESVWNLALLVYVTDQVTRSAPSNIAEHVERLNNQQRGGF